MLQSSLEPSTQSSRYTAICADGTRIACHRFGQGSGTPIILTHGTFSSHEGCQGLAQHLAQCGHDVWAFDWRGHGASDQPSEQYDFETVAVQDVPAVKELVQQETQTAKSVWLAHSGGGLVMAMWMARHPDLANQDVLGLGVLATQANRAATLAAHRQRIDTMADWLTDMDVIPARALGVGSDPESAHLMRQWCRWNLSGAFHGAQGFDYLAALPNLHMPILSLAGTGDHFVAPPQGCFEFANAFGSTDKTLVECGKSHGFLEDYEHGRILASSAARQEIWPYVAQWVSKHV